MSYLAIEPGAQVQIEGRAVTVVAVLALDQVLVRDDNPPHEVFPVSVSQLDSLEAAVPPAPDLSTIGQANWDVARARQPVIEALAGAVASRARAAEAAVELGCSIAQVYRLLRRWRESGGQLQALMPRKRGNPRSSRLTSAKERIIGDVVEQLYLTKQRRRPEAVVDEVSKRLRRAGEAPVSPTTVRLRLRRVGAYETTRRREGARVARTDLGPFPGSFPGASRPLQVIQIDHTLVDVLVVDEAHRRVIDRPWLTLAIDVFSRCVWGYYLSLDPPDATSVGIVIAQGLTPKDKLVAQHGVEARWPVYGRPDAIHVDNAEYFHSAALEHGCAFHGIAIDFRKPGAPYMGGHIERLIGTLMGKVHMLPGTTFSSTEERRGYRSDQTASLTMRELDQWLAINVAQVYHLKKHKALGRPPVAVYEEAMLDGADSRGLPPVPTDPHRLLIDFLPLERRKVRREGIVWDRIWYYSSALKPLIHEGEVRVIARRDPRDLSRIFVFPPKSPECIEVPYANLGRPPISLWEHRQALRWLAEQGDREVDEEKIFSASDRLREIDETAAKTTKAARRRVQRRRDHAAARRPDPLVAEPPMPISRDGPSVAAADAPPRLKRPFSDLGEG